jgi:hypothetical protein
VDSVVLTLAADSLVAGSVYVFTLCLDCGLFRQARASVRVTATAPPEFPAPLVSVRLEGVEGAVVNADQALRVVSSVVSQSTTPATELELQWSIVAAEGTFDLAAARTTELGASSLVLSPDALAPGRRYTVSLRAVDPATPAGASSGGAASLQLTVNTPPAGGSCTASPSGGGEAFATEVTVACDGAWTDEHEPLAVAFYYRVADG